MELLCKRCLLSEVSTEVYQQVIEEYLQSIPSEKKADPATYGNRLSICRECDDLMNGLCRVCGCFVEARAVKKQSCCPAVERKW